MPMDTDDQEWYIVRLNGNRVAWSAYRETREKAIQSSIEDTLASPNEHIYVAMPYSELMKYEGLKWWE